MNKIHWGIIGPGAIAHNTAVTARKGKGHGAGGALRAAPACDVMLFCCHRGFVHKCQVTVQVCQVRSGGRVFSEQNALSCPHGSG